MIKPETGREHRSPRILVADDSLMQREVAIRILRREGYSVSLAENGQDAVDAARNGSFDLILMDVEMPQMDGLEAAREIRAAERGTSFHVPMIAVTSTPIRQQCLAAGMDEFVPKPLSRAALLDAVRKLLGPGSSSDSTGGRKILVADDDPSVVESLRYALEASSFRVIVAEDGESALEMIRQHGPDLAILDLMMPKRSGLSVLEELRGSCRSSVPVIVITGCDFRALRTSAGDLGDIDYIAKPFPPNHVIERVRRMLVA